MPKKISVAPKERVNITYKSNLDGAEQEIELPFRMLVLGDFTQRADDRLLEDRDALDVNKDNFNRVLKEQELSINVNVPNVMSGVEGDEIGATLRFEDLKDFSPDRVAEQVPELKKVLDIRNALAALKGPLGNMREFRKQLEDTLNNQELVDRFMAVVNAGEGSSGPAPDVADVAGADGPAPGDSPSDDPAPADQPDA
ncbi:MAG: type VI secretion system contractile sheath small subunit [Planctomycetota bacterium]